MPLAVSPAVFQLFIGAVYGLMGLAVWVLSPAAQDRWPARWWALSALALGLSSLFTVGRQLGWPLWLGFAVAPALDTLAFVLRIQALRRHRRVALHWRRVAWCVLAAALAYALCLLSDDRRLRVSCINAVLGLCAAGLAWQAWQVCRAQPSMSARLLWISEALLAAALLMRMVTVWFVRGGVSWDFLLLFVVGTLAGIYSGMGFLGLVVNTLHSAELQARAARIGDAAAREAAERSADELRALIVQRDHMVGERDRMLEVLAYAIRQPLHNASSALQAATGELQRMSGEAAGHAAARLQRARAVLDTVNTVLDDTLAAGPSPSHTLGPADVPAPRRGSGTP